MFRSKTAIPHGARVGRHPSSSEETEAVKQQNGLLNLQIAELKS